MNWPASLGVAVLTAILGLFGTGWFASAYARWTQMSNREGAVGYFIIFLALLGGVAGLVAGLVIARWTGSPDSIFWKPLACSTGFVAVGLGLVAGFCYLQADIPPRLAGDKLRLEVEIRLPAGQDKPAGKAAFTLGSVAGGTQRASRYGELDLAGARREGDRWILPARVELFTSRGQRVILATVEGQTLAAFQIPLPARPRVEHESWSVWFPNPPEGSPPWPDSKASCRYRVQRIPGT